MQDPTEVVEEAHAWLSSPPPVAARTWQLSGGFGTGVAEPSYVELYGGTAGGPPPVRATFRVDAPSSCDCLMPPPPPPPPAEPAQGGAVLLQHRPGRSGPVRKCRRTAVSTVRHACPPHRSLCPHLH